MILDWLKWQHSRVLIRPTFLRVQMTDVQITGLLRIIPRNGSAVDLKSLFKLLAVDSLTEL